MIATYTAAEMSALWRRYLGFETLRTDCAVSTFHGIDLDAWIAMQMRIWYLGLLSTAAIDLIPTAITAPQAVAPLGSGVFASLPGGFRRPFAVDVEGIGSIAIEPGDSLKARRRIDLARWPLAAPGSSSPVAYDTPQGIFIAPASTSSKISIHAVRDPGPSTYILDESLIATIPKD